MCKPTVVHQQPPPPQQHSPRESFQRHDHDDQQQLQQQESMPTGTATISSSVVPTTSSSSKQQPQPSAKQPPPSYRYAQRFALLTLITAYLGKRASGDDAAVAAAVATGDTHHATALSVGFWLYDYLLPGLSTTAASWPPQLLSLVLLVLAVNKFLQAARYQMKQWQRTLTQQALQSVKSVSEITTRACGSGFLKPSNNNKSMATNGSSSCESVSSQQPPPPRRLVLSDTESFLPSEIMEQMTLADMAHLFQYAQRHNRAGFDSEPFLQSVRTPARQAIQAMNAATAESRGAGVQVLLLNEDNNNNNNSTSDNMDALAFCAVTRIFAEWRNVRAVPKGCPGYAFGMNLARRDLIQNVRKVEQAVHQWLDFYQGGVLVPMEKSNGSSNNNTANNNAATMVRCSPTLRQLLQHELEIQLHPRLPQLMENSAASGLLWIKRQIQYQSSAMENNAKVPSPEFETPKAAFNAAYESVYGKYHGFLVRTVFQNTFEAAPPAKDVLKHMNQPYENDEDSKEEQTEEQDSSIDQPCLQDYVNVSSSEEQTPSPTEDEKQAPSSDDDDETWIQLPLEEWEGELTSLDEQNISQNLTAPNNTALSHSDENSLLEYRDDDDDEDEGPHDLDLGGRIVQVLTTVFGHCLVCKDDEREVQRTRNALSSFHASGTDKDLVEKLMLNTTTVNHTESIRSTASTSSTASSSPSSSSSSPPTKKAERNDVPLYLSTVRFMEDGLERLILELNMNDPSRV